MKPDVPRSNPVTVAFLIGVACLLIYLRGVNGPLLYDDFPNLQPLLDPTRDLGTALKESALSITGPTGRPISKWSFIASRAVHGDATAAWKAENVLIHLLSGWLAYLLISRLCNLVSVTTASLRWIPALATTLWLLHPLHVSTVLYLVQRMTLLSTFFTLAGLAAFTVGRMRLEESCTRSNIALTLIPLLLCSLFATLSKESGALTPLYAMLIELIFFRDSSSHSQFRLFVANHKFMFTAAAASTTASVIYVLHALTSGYAGRSYTLQERLLTEFNVLIEYIRLTIAPQLSSMKFYHDDFPINSSWFEPNNAAMSAAALLLLLALSWQIRRTQPLASFGLLLFMTSHLIESTVIPLNIMHEHRQYLGSFGLITAITAVANSLLPRGRLSPAFAAVALATLSSLTTMRVITWSDEGRLYESLLAADSRSEALYSQLTIRLIETGNHEKAESILSEAAQTPVLRSLQALLDCSSGRHLNADEIQGIGEIQHFGFVESATLENLSQAIVLGQCSADLESLKVLIDNWTSVSRGAPTTGVDILMGHVLHHQGDTQRAVQLIESIADNNPQYLLLYYIAARWEIQTSNLKNAKILIDKAVVTEESVGLKGHPFGMETLEMFNANN